VRRQRGSFSIATTALAALVVTGCVAGPAPVTIEREPFRPDTAMMAVPVEGMLLPYALDGLRVIDPEWVLPAQGRDGVLLSASEQGGLLEYTALDSDGTALWAAQRPASCTGFLVTVDASGRALAVLTDIDSTTDAVAATTATAVDLLTGEHVWGPVEVPGPLGGIGLVFASTPRGVIGSAGPATVLDASTGEVALEELDGRRVLGELRGTALVVEGTELLAVSTTNGATLWRVEAEYLGIAPAELAIVTARSGADLADDLVLLGPDGVTSERVLLELSTGEVRARGLDDALTDALSGITVVRDAVRLSAVDAEGQTVWSEPIERDTFFAAAGNALLYLRHEQSVVVRNVQTGAIAEGYEPAASGTIVLPRRFTIQGAAMVEVGQRELMVTTTPAD